MDCLDRVEDDVREILVEDLARDTDEIVPAAQFFQDLDGESIDVIDLRFRYEKYFGVDVPFQDFANWQRIETEPDGRLTEVTIQRIREEFPFLDESLLRSAESQDDLKALFAVEAITQLVRQGLATKTANENRICQSSTTAIHADCDSPHPPPPGVSMISMSPGPTSMANLPPRSSAG